MDAFRYDDSDIHRTYAQARVLPDRALRLWLDALVEHVPVGDVGVIADVGCGTGRFLRGLAERYGAIVLGLDPSRKMLAEARREVGDARVRLIQGVAESLPLRDGTVDLAFLSMVYHHLSDRPAAIREFRRILSAQGYLAVRMAVRERLDSYLWLRFFPAAQPIEFGRTPSRQELIDTLRGNGFSPPAHSVVRHPFADNLTHYAEKIGMRGLSSLKQIPDDQFEAGIAQLRRYCREHDTGEPLFEDIDLFVSRPA
jgi:ubiquinone/menaquinone biosynthesis C-methylase UbiE